MTALVEGFDADARGLARFLVESGEAVRIAASGQETAEVAALRDLGIRVEPWADLDADPGEAEVAYLDVWTPEVAPRVARLRAQGTHVSCLGDLLLERWPGRTIGITGTAGKTTTTSLVASILRADGNAVAVSAGSRAGNLWPTADLLDLLGTAGAAETTLVVELTSSHLAFMRHSPTVAAIVSFWPDHLELHGTLARYREAKATIFRHQSAADAVLVNDDDAAAELAREARGRVVEFSLLRAVEQGAYLDSRGSLVVAEGGSAALLGPLATAVSHPGNAVAAAAVAAAAGASTRAIVDGLGQAGPLPYRARPLAVIGGLTVVDDGMAATPMKTAALLATFPPRSVVLVAGGMDDAGGGPVHATPEEDALLTRACDEVARAACAVVLFGAGGARIESRLAERGVLCSVATTLEAALDRAARPLPGASHLVFSPMFPISLEERVGFEATVAQLDARRSRR